MNEKLYIHLPDGLHGYGICFNSEDQERLYDFVCYCKSEIPERFGVFHQAGSKINNKYDSWQYFEFLKYYKTLTVDQQDEIFNVASKIADMMNIELTI